MKQEKGQKREEDKAETIEVCFAASCKSCHGSTQRTKIYKLLRPYLPRGIPFVSKARADVLL